MAADAPHPAFESYAAEAVPPVDVGSPGKAGQLDLAFATGADGQTRLVKDYARVPFHLSGTLAHDPHPDAETVYVQSPSGGVAQGDRHEISVDVGDDAVAHVSDGSATKVLSMECNYGAADLSLSVGPDGHLDYVPEPLILHADARFCQDLTLTVAPGGTAVVGEVVVPGRLARGERFEFDRYVSRVRVRDDADRLLCEDVTHLDPATSDPQRPGVLGEYAVTGALYVVAPDDETAALADRIHDRIADAQTDGRAGATALPNDAGVLVRALGHGAEGVTRTLHAAWDEARRDLIDAGAPAGRKQ